MAKKDEPKTVLERTYNVPLRRAWLKVAIYKRAKKAVTELARFLAKNMKTDIKDVRIGKYANMEIWKRGIKRPPHHIKITATKDDQGIVVGELVGAPKEPVVEKQEKKKSVPEKTAKSVEKAVEKPQEMAAESAPKDSSKSGEPKKSKPKLAPKKDMASSS